MKKLTKTLMVSGIVASMLASGFAFAGTDDETTGRGFGQRGSGDKGDRPQISREAGDEEGGKGFGKRGGNSEDKEERHTKMMEIVTEYAPELVDDFESIHEQAQANFDANSEEREAHREEMKTLMESYREKVENGEMTREEVREEMEALREANRPGDAEDRPSKEEMQAKREAFETALENGDAETIVEHLEEILAHMTERLENME